jgi:hypothetical protein
MAEHKRQHFVPQFYLRNFADADRATIGVFNLASGRLIRGAGLKTQAYRNYFYGKDGEAERRLGVVETQMSQVIGNVIRTGRPPKRFSEDHLRLVFFVMLQVSRTASAEADAKARADMVAKLFLRQAHENRPDVLAALDRVKIGRADEVVRAMDMALTGAPALYDLEFKLLVNTSPTPFVTSDHPIARHNQLFENVTSLDTVGFGLSGLQIFAPLSPRLALLFYDDQAYKVGTPASRLVPITHSDHAQQINLLQWLDAHENVFCGSQSKEADIRACAVTAAAWPPRRAPWFEEAVVERSETQKRIVGVYRAAPRPTRLVLPFVRLRIPPPETNGVVQLPMRFPEWMEVLRTLGADLRSGRISKLQYQQATTRVPVRTRARRRV